MNGMSARYTEAAVQVPANNDRSRSWLKLKERNWKIRLTKVDAGDFKQELLNQLRSTTAVNVLRSLGTPFSNATRLHVILFTGTEYYLLRTDSEAFVAVCPFYTWTSCLESKVDLAQSWPLISLWIHGLVCISAQGQFISGSTCVLGLLVISVSYRAVELAVSRIRTHNVYPVRGEFWMWNIDLSGGNCHTKWGNAPSQLLPCKRSCDVENLMYIYKI